MNQYANVEIILSKIQHWKSILELTDELLPKMLNVITVDASQFQEVCIAVLFHKISESTNASLELVNLGFLNSAKVLIRTSLEGLFVLRAIRLDDGNIHKLYKHDEAFRKTLLNVIKERKHFSEIKKVIESENILMPDETDCEKTVVEAWAKLADLHEFYDYMYRTLSNEIHTNLRSITKSLERDSKGELTSFIVEPSYSEIDRLLHSILAIKISAMDDLNIHFNLGFQDQISLCINMVKSASKTFT